MIKREVKDEFETLDQILPTILNPRKPVKIKIAVLKETVFLQIGPRDWEWDRRSRKLVGGGTRIVEEVQW